MGAPYIYIYIYIYIYDISSLRVNDLYCRFTFYVAQPKKGDTAQLATWEDGGHCADMGVLSLRIVITHDLHQPSDADPQRR